MPKRRETSAPSLSELIRKFSKNDVIAEMEKEYQSLASKNIPLPLIDDNAFVKKVIFPENSITPIAKSVAEKGLFNPLVVRPSGSHYELILGRKRYFAAKKAKLAEVPAVIYDAGDEETLLMLLADTRDQREGNVVEMALVYRALSSRFAYSQTTLANLSHESRSQVTNTMRILSLPESVIDEVMSGRLSYGHARAIASLSDEEIEEAVRQIHEHNLSVRETEALAKRFSLSPSLCLTEAERLKNHFGATSVSVRKASLTFSFSSAEKKEDFVKGLLKK